MDTEWFDKRVVESVEQADRGAEALEGRVAEAAAAIITTGGWSELPDIWASWEITGRWSRVGSRMRNGDQSAEAALRAEIVTTQRQLVEGLMEERSTSSVSRAFAEAKRDGARSWLRQAEGLLDSLDREWQKEVIG